jgi:hypothetical protein
MYLVNLDEFIFKDIDYVLKENLFFDFTKSESKKILDCVKEMKNKPYSKYNLQKYFRLYKIIGALKEVTIKKTTKNGMSEIIKSIW